LRFFLHFFYFCLRVCNSSLFGSFCFSFSSCFGFFNGLFCISLSLSDSSICSGLGLFCCFCGLSLGSFGSRFSFFLYLGNSFIRGDFRLLCGFGSLSFSCSNCLISRKLRLFRLLRSLSFRNRSGFLSSSNFGVCLGFSLFGSFSSFLLCSLSLGLCGFDCCGSFLLGNLSSFCCLSSFFFCRCSRCLSSLFGSFYFLFSRFVGFLYL